MKRRRKDAVYVPDGGWGWVIVACSFLIHMFVVGTLYALSVLYVSWLEAFNNGKGVTSWIISMAVAVMFGIGPLPGSLSKRFGNRPIVMMGGIMMSAGFFISSLAMNVYFLIVTVGLMAGVGAGCCYLPSVALVAQYFTSKRSLAMGISASGLGVGAFFMAPFLNWLVEYFGWRGTMQILSGISLNVCVLASLMRPLELAPHCRNCEWIEESEWTTELQDHPLMTDTEESCGKHNCENDEEKSENSDEQPRETEKRRERIFACTCGKPNQRMIRMLDANINMSPINYFPSPAFIQNKQIMQIPYYKNNSHHHPLQPNVIRILRKEDVRPFKALSVDEMSSKAVPLPASTQCDCLTVPKTNLTAPMGGSLNDLGLRPLDNLQRSFTFSHIPSPVVKTLRCDHVDGERALRTPSMAGDLNTKHDCASDAASSHLDPETGGMSADCQDNEIIAGNDEGKVQTEDPNITFLGRNLQMCCSIKTLKSAAVYVKLMQSGIFMVFCASNFLTNLSFLMPVLYMVDRAIDSGIGKREAAILVSLYGTGNIFGKVFFGWLADRKFLDRLLYYIFCLSMCGGATCLSPLCGSSHTLHGLYAFVFGCFIGAYCTLFPLVTVDLVGMSVVEESFGMLLCFMGTATAFGTPLAGWMFDFTGSYTWAFFLHGAFILISALMLIPVLMKKRRVTK